MNKYIKELADLTYQKLHETYGETIPQECLKRADRELLVIGRNDINICSILAAAKLIGKAVEKGWTVGTRGSIASSYIAYLLGITEINPLDAHYYCPKCHYVEFHSEYYCGADMEDKICKCGTKLKKDGFTVPPETLFHTDGSFVFSIDLNFPNEYLSQALEDKKAVCAMIDQSCKSEGDKLYQDHEIEHFADHLDMLCHDMPSMLKRLEELTGVASKKIPFDDEKTMKLFADGNTQEIPEFGAEAVRKILLNKIGIHSFDDLIRISGLSHGVGVWYENGEALIDAGKTLSDIVSCRDDVMLYLISHGLERKDAFEISDRIRKGKGLTEEQYARLKNIGAHNWRLDSWNKIKYSFPRAHAASYVLLAYRVAYYKANHEDEFNRAMTTHI